MNILSVCSFTIGFFNLLHGVIIAYYRKLCFLSEKKTGSTLASIIQEHCFIMFVINSCKKVKIRMIQN